MLELQLYTSSQLLTDDLYDVTHVITTDVTFE